MTTRLRRTLLALTAFAATAACSGSSGPNIPQDAVISIDLQPALPDGGYGAINLAAAYVGSEQTETLQVLNGGRHALNISGVRLAAIDGGALNYLDAGGVFGAAQYSDPLPAVIPGLDAGFVVFTYKPNKPGKSVAKLVVDSDAPARGHLEAEIDTCAIAIDAGVDAGC